MPLKLRFIAAGAVFIVLGLFLYFTLRFKYVEKDRIGSLVRTTNAIVGEYRDMEKRMAGGNRAPSPDDLSAFLAAANRRHGEVALMAITDRELSVRLSSKNDRYIRSAELFEAVLKDFTQDKFNITRENPYTIRYYEEKSRGAAEQVKFYIFLNKIGQYRLLVVYPHTVLGPVRARTALEVALLVLLIVIITAAAYILAAGKPALVTAAGRTAGKAAVRADDPHIIDLGTGGGSVSPGAGSPAHETANVVSDGLSGYVRSLFNAINASCDTDAVSLYVFHPAGKLVKTMELAGETFLRIDSVTFDTIDIDNEAGRELRGGATMVLDEGRTIILPLSYNGVFLGAVKMERRQGLQGGRIGDARTAVAGVLKDIHDHITANDVMTDADTGLHGKIFYNLKYHECVKAWKGKGKDFSVLFVLLSGAIGRVGDADKSRIIKLVAPAAADIVRDDGFLCRHDDYLAIIMPEMDSRKARGLEKRLKGSLERFRIRTGDDTVVAIDPLIGIASTDTAGPDGDPAALALRQVAPPGGA